MTETRHPGPSMNDTLAPHSGPTSDGITHAMTVDVEDYFQVSAFETVVMREHWPSFQRRVCANTHRLLDLFDVHRVSATFFVLGWVAEREPQLVREIAARGHEVASHGYSHRLVFEQSPREFEEEARRSKAIIEDEIQASIEGYRAASYSITGRSLWALEILASLGFSYDSSIFPVHHDRYGIPDAPSHIHRVRSGSSTSLVEFPLASLRILGNNLPVAGGGYFRFYPYALTRHFLRRLARQTQAPFVFYLHPWEVDPDQPRIADAGMKSRFRHYLNLERCLPRLERLLRDFRFGTVAEALAQVHGGDIQRLPLHQYSLPQNA